MVAKVTPRTRIAPTPSGYLHLGNLYNFILNKVFALQNQGELLLRLDDIDFNRVRPEYIEDIFRNLEWLGIEYDLGPAGPDDFYAHYSQPKKRDLYLTYLKRLPSQFVCSCSRKEVFTNSQDGQYAGTCASLKLSYQRDQTVIRFKTDSDYSLFNINPHQDMRDFVVWSREDLPSYQLVSVVDDIEFNINHAFRGEDLKASTAAQSELALSLGEERFKNIVWAHHRLLRGKQGEKLSKARKSLSLQELKGQGFTKGEVYQLLAKMIGLGEARSFQDLTDFAQLSISELSLYRHP